MITFDWHYDSCILNVLEELLELLRIVKRNDAGTYYGFVECNAGNQCKTCVFAVKSLRDPADVTCAGLNEEAEVSCD